jgi:hypothetical protein
LKVEGENMLARQPTACQLGAHQVTHAVPADQRKQTHFIAKRPQRLRDIIADAETVLRTPQSG